MPTIKIILASHRFFFTALIVTINACATRGQNDVYLAGTRSIDEESRFAPKELNTIRE